MQLINHVSSTKVTPATTPQEDPQPLDSNSANQAVIQTDLHKLTEVALNRQPSYLSKARARIHSLHQRQSDWYSQFR